jgi:hypothetical protein
MKIMLEADKCIYVLWREIILLSINSRNNYIEHGIKQIMEFSIDTIFVGDFILEIFELSGINNIEN